MRLQALTIKQAEPIDLDNVTKPQMKNFAPGTLDKEHANDERTVFEVSASLWKGSSGGPCVLLDGIEGGAIIGLGKESFLVFQVESLREAVLLIHILCI